MHFAAQNPATSQQLIANESWFGLTIRSEFSVICGLGVGLGVISMELPAGTGALATRRFIAQARLTASGICSASSAGMMPWESKNS